MSRSAFLAALPARAQAFADAGLGPAQLTAKEEHRLDEHYLLVRTEWAAPRLAGGDPVRLVSSFLLHDDGTRLQTIAYLNHEGPPKSHEGPPKNPEGPPKNPEGPPRTPTARR